MEQNAQATYQENANKPKKKGKIIVGIILGIIVIAIIALISVYFLVFSKPENIFSMAIDKITTLDTKTFDTIKVSSEIKPTIEIEDETANELAQEINKFSLSVGAQMDYQNQGEIVDLGLKYDDESVVSGKLYYNDGKIYAYLEDIFDKYISVDLNEEDAKQFKELFDLTTIQNKKENAKLALSILGDEIIEQINSNGTFEKSKEDMNLNGKNTSVTKMTLVLNEKELSTVIANICNNLANNEEFLNCYEESPKDALEEMASDMEDNELTNDNEFRISLYTTGLLYNVVGFGIEIDIKDDEDLSMSAMMLKESNELYTFSYNQGEDYIDGKLELQIDENSKEKQSGNAKITLQISDGGTISMDINYSTAYNEPIDEIDINNSIKAEDLSQEDLLGIMEKLMERPIIGDFVSGLMIQSNLNNMFNNATTNNNNNSILLTENNNQLTNNDYTITYDLPSQLVYDSSFSNDSLKYYLTADDSINAMTEIEWNEDEQSVIDIIDSNYEIYNNNYYSNVQISDLQTIDIGNYTFKYKSLSYETSLGDICQAITLWYRLDNEYIYKVEIESNGTTISNDTITPFLNITVQ